MQMEIFLISFLLKGKKMKTTFDLIILNAQAFVNNSKFEKTDIGIKGNKIQEIGNLSRCDSKIKIDVENLLVLPGAIDTKYILENLG